MKKYPSDLTREQFEKIRIELERAQKRTKPRSLDLYDVFNALLYVVKTGCQWRALPRDYPKWRSVHRYFQVWSQPRKSKIQEKENADSVLTEVLKKINAGNAYKKWQERQDLIRHH